MTLTKTAKKRTEGEMLGLLRARHGEKAGNGEANAFIPKVRSHAGFDARRTIDAINVTLWPSRGLIIDAFEIKCDRGDWLREMKNPAKGEEFARVVDRFWLVVADDAIVKDGELPEGWGLHVAQGNRLVTKVEAKMLHAGSGPMKDRPLPPGFGRSFLAALCREACRQGAATPEDIRVAVEEATASQRRHHDEMQKLWKGQYEELRAKVQEFQRHAGIQIETRWPDNDAKAVGAAVRAVLQGEHRTDIIESRLRRVVEDAQKVADAGREHLAEFGLEAA
jgi:hypothetical protein